ncbi:hypothetical protein [Streptomyces pinistramenti]|uniref:hypothetical protein n=1 Tax=Streptomyces pinistramenti TaxID=2884812 RepID=UPI001D06CDC4|nr:hypothetical protein [Streptomyces pinistramenti]MCB5912204.1 hypothetical protein [Streptomyces pinistramenti]
MTARRTEPTAPPHDQTPRDAAAPPQRRGPADPVRILMHRHRALCERAVDALEIAARLEAYGVTDRTAARFRHRDVFSLAEELYARVPRAASCGAPVPQDEPAPRPLTVRAALHLLPGALCAATLAATAAARPVTPLVRPATATAGAVLVVLAVRLCLCTGPLRARQPGGGAPAAVLCAAWLTGYALFGDRLLAQLLGGGPDFPFGLPQPATATALALACAVAPAAWCARWFAVRGRRGLAASRGLGELATRVRPLLLAATLLFLGAQTALLLGAGRLTGDDGTAVPAAAALGVLLFLSRLLAVHGFPAAAAAGPAAAAVLEALALALVLIARLPGLTFVDRPVDLLIAFAGPSAVPAVACTAAALGLLGHALRALAGACAHPPARSLPAEAGRP